MEVAMHKILWTMPGLLVLPLVVFGQSQVPVTHAALQAEIAQLRDVGWHPTGRGLKYPADVQAAERAVAEKKAHSSGGSGSSE